MTIDELIRPDSVLCNARARSKKHCLEILSELLANSAPDIPNEEIFSRLVERERLGCTGLTRGTAFPHCRIEGLVQSCGAMIKLDEPVDFDTADGEMVDLVIGLIVPADMDDTHAAEIRMIAAALEDDALRDRLRQSATSKELYTNLIDGLDNVRPESGVDSDGDADGLQTGLQSDP